MQVPQSLQIIPLEPPHFVLEEETHSSWLLESRLVPGYRISHTALTKLSSLAGDGGPGKIVLDGSGTILLLLRHPKG